MWVTNVQNCFTLARFRTKLLTSEYASTYLSFWKLHLDATIQVRRVMPSFLQDARSNNTDPSQGLFPYICMFMLTR